MLDLERAAGCHDRAVLGGLDAFLDRQAGQSAEVQEFALRLAPARYRELSPAARAAYCSHNERPRNSSRPGCCGS